MVKMALTNALKSIGMKNLYDLFRSSADVIPANSVEDLHFDSTFIVKQGIHKLTFLQNKGTA